MRELTYPMTHEWHVSVNAHQDRIRTAGLERAGFMYDAMAAAREVPRLASLFAQERKGELRKTHTACSQVPAVALAENRLMCCLGTPCATCPHLTALDGMPRATPEDVDAAKAWTCVAHIIATGGDMANEGYVLDASDRMYWDDLHQSLAEGMDATPPTNPADSGGKGNG